MKIFILPVIFAIVLAGCTPKDLFSLMAQSEIEQAAGDAITQSEEVIANTQAITDEKSNQYSQSADLMSTKEDGSYGYGYRNSFSESGFMHEVLAVLPPLEEGGAFYEGWLVNPTTSKFISTGRMSLAENDIFRTLLFTADTDYTMYKKIVITKELISDATPEEHVLDGSFGE